MTGMFDHKPNLEPFKLFIIGRESLLAPTELNKPYTFLSIEFTEYLPEVFNDIWIFSESSAIPSVSSQELEVYLALASYPYLKISARDAIKKRSRYYLL